MPTTPQDLDALASRSNQAAAKFGYSSCSVRSYNPPVLAFQCADPITAELVAARLELMDVKNVGIDPNNLSVVLRHV